MNSFKNPLVPLIVDPVNIDIPIQDLQQALTALPWLEKSFGRSFIAVRQDAFNRLITYPEVWQGKDKDLLNVMPNDNLNSQSFFKVEDPIETVDYWQSLYAFMRARVNIIFWFNLKCIDPDIDWRFTETLKAQAQRIITEATFSNDHSNIKILRSWEEPENVFKGYTIDKQKQQELIHPYGGFRFECELTYLENCPTPQLP